MLGETINKFDNLPENKANLESFNKMFKMSLKGDLSVPVEILGLSTGGLREVVIGGKKELIRWIQEKLFLPHRTESTQFAPMLDSAVVANGNKLTTNTN